MARRNRNRKSRPAARENQAKRVPPVSTPRERPHLTILAELKQLRANTRKLTSSLDAVRQHIGMVEDERHRAWIHEDCASSFIHRLHEEARTKIQTFVEGLVNEVLGAGRKAHEETQMCLDHLQNQEGLLEDMHLTCARAVEQTLCFEVKLADLEQRLRDKPAV